MRRQRTGSASWHEKYNYSLMNFLKSLINNHLSENTENTLALTSI
ncbi:7207_t:CDS:2 [Rhizophagus irregularis]|nr:7207_t:CDS:2 [Rhizophagus irregularis]